MKVIRIVPDAVVLGLDYGKLLREMAMRTGTRVVLGSDAQKVDLVILAGDAVLQARTESSTPLLLLAPARVEDDHARTVLEQGNRVILLLPEIDEDGRCAVWREAAAKASREELSIHELSGVGTQVPWAWQEVIELASGVLRRGTG